MYSELFSRLITLLNFACSELIDFPTWPLLDDDDNDDALSKFIASVKVVCGVLYSMLGDIIVREYGYW